MTLSLAATLSPAPSAREVIAELHPTPRILSLSDLLVNATSIGLYPNVNEKPNPYSDSIGKGAYVRDVANLAFTPFLREAERVLSRPFGGETPSHQCGTVRFGDDPAASCLTARYANGVRLVMDFLPNPFGDRAPQYLSLIHI